MKWKTLCNKSCRYCFIESRTVEFVFLWFLYDFISILQIHYLMRPALLVVPGRFILLGCCVGPCHPPFFCWIGQHSGDGPQIYCFQRYYRARLSDLCTRTMVNDVLFYCFMHACLQQYNRYTLIHNSFAFLSNFF